MDIVLFTQIWNIGKILGWGLGGHKSCFRSVEFAPLRYLKGNPKQAAE